jgi:glycosyltransferase involved in cell wall biosynthesis
VLRPPLWMPAFRGMTARWVGAKLYKPTTRARPAVRILYLTNETPIFPAGGIGTYIGYAARAMAEAGHDVFLFSWTYEDYSIAELKYTPFIESNVHILKVVGKQVWEAYPNGPYNHGLSNYILMKLSECVEHWCIDVVEATDFLSPALAFFQDLQTRSSKRNVLCVTYNHGFIEDFYEADQIIPNREAQDDLVGERQQCRVSDLVVAPSVSAMRRLASFGIVDNVNVVREPYEFAVSNPLHIVRPIITYIGRISISKGIDKIIFLANLIHESFPIEQILLIGKCVNTPFKTYDIPEYIRTRLHPKLASLVMFAGTLKRSIAINLLVPGAVSPSLGSADTFSYACVETIDRGLLPIVRHGTPMAEFFPQEFQEYVFDEEFGDFRGVQQLFEKLLANAKEVVAAVQQFNVEALRPAAIATQMAKLYEAGLRAKKGFRSMSVRQPATIEDVTVMIPAYRPEEIFFETVDSIVGQTAGTPNVLICDDGTPQAAKDCFEYARLRLPGCRFVEQPNNGLLGARNTLIRENKTRLSLFLDTDDLLAPTYVERTLEAYNSSVFLPNAVLTFRKNFGESDEVVIRYFSGDHIHLIRNDLRMTGLIETEVLREIGYDSTRRNGEGDDWVFWLDFNAAGYRSVIIPEILFYYRFRQGSMSWPWSMGQTSGTHTMVREAVAKLSRRRPSEAASVTRALHSITTVCE